MTEQEILEKVKIEEVVSKFLPPKRDIKSNDWRFVCPFHEEINPSFSVDTDRQFYYCYGCKVSGNVVNFVEKFQKVSKQEAILLIAKLMDIEIESDPLILLQNLTDYYSSKVKDIKPYLVERKLSPLIDSWQLGYSGSSIKSLAKDFPNDLELLEQLGFIQRKFKDTPHETLHSTFTNRLMIPLVNQLGTIGFVGRALGSDFPKYRNTKESQFFHRNKFLFGLNQAREYIIDSGYSILVEGPIDVGMAHIHNYKHTVGSLGTMINKTQLEQLKPLAETVVLLFDDDEGGKTALNKAIFECLSAGLDVQIALGLEGMDPDDYLKSGKTLNNLNIIPCRKYAQDNFEKPEIKEYIKSNKQNLDMLPEWLISDFNINIDSMKSEPKMQMFNSTAIQQLTNKHQLALFLDVHDKFKNDLTPTQLSEINVLSRSSEVINLIVNKNNFFENVKDTKTIFNKLFEVCYGKN